MIYLYLIKKKDKIILKNYGGKIKKLKFSSV